MRRLTANETRALELLKKWGPMTCATLGSRLWGKQYRKPQSYCLPAGRLLRRMVRMGLVKRTLMEHHIEWTAIE